MNVLSCIGRVGQNAENKSTPNGDQVTEFSVAMDSGWGQNKKTTWLRCAIWGDRGIKLAPYILKGDRIGVTGELSVREWVSGSKSGYSVELRINDVTLLGDKREAAAPAPAPAAAPAGDGIDDDDIPF